jgi:hypothetical protein
MTRTNVYREAARLIDSGKEEYSCVAIREVMRNDGDAYGTMEMQEAYVLMFQPVQLDNYGYFGEQSYRLQQGIYDEYGALNDKACRDFRVLALCFMAAVSDRS